MQAYAATPTIQNGVTIGGIDVSGMNDMEAAEAVNNKVNSDISSEIIIHCVEGKIATLPVKDINLKWKNTNVPTEAMSYGNRGNFVKRYKERKDIARNGLDLPLEYSFDRDKLSEFVDNNCMIYNEEAIEATITRTEEGFTITPGTTGVIIDKQEAMDFITNYIENEWNGDNAEINLP
ncbi:MAG: peptidoglycan binding domain-containing protein, partial [Lachnospiraceae bacterium]|nr:peptidoglycan binding domain-containing protein [Lachnospiraceae bacterium]